MGFVAASVCGLFQSSARRARLVGNLNALGLLVLRAVPDGQRRGLSVGLGRLYALSREDGRACIRHRPMDCFRLRQGYCGRVAEPVLGRAFARPVGSE